MCRETFIILLGFGAVCVISALDMEESITINKPVIRTESPSWSQLSTDDETVDYELNQSVINRVHNTIFADPTKNLKGSIRCFCNLPACVSTGYMCKSSGGVCFSDLIHRTSKQSAYHGRHGCLELLTDKEERNQCQKYPNENQHPIRRKNTHPKSLFYCCYRDMCNHADNPETKHLINDTTLGGISNDEKHAVHSQLDNDYHSSDVWFKAATIAVPICGAVILFALIALAIKLLKTDTFDNVDYKLGCVYSSQDEKRTSKKHAEHFRTSQHLLYKDCALQQASAYRNHIILEKQQSRFPVIIDNKDPVTKDAEINFYNKSEYNLLSRDPQTFNIHESYQNKGNLEENFDRLQTGKSSLPEIGYCNPVTIQSGEMPWRQ